MTPISNVARRSTVLAGIPNAGAKRSRDLRVRHLASLSIPSVSHYVLLRGFANPVGALAAFPIDDARPMRRKDEAYAFICERLVSTGVSPSLGEIAAHLGVSLTRAKALVHQLSREQMIHRNPGAHRAITVPGLFDELVIADLRRKGWTVDRDVLAEPALPKGHLPLVAIVGHDPAILAGDHHVDLPAGGDL